MNVTLQMYRRNWHIILRSSYSQEGIFVIRIFMMGCLPWKGCLTCFRSDTSSTIYDYDSSTSSRSDLNIPTRPNQSRRRYLRCCSFRSIYSRRIMCCFRNTETNMTKLEKTVKATLLIQRWFRRYMARLEIRRRYTWTIFQSLEYAGEQDQVKLYNFFNALLTHIPQTCNRGNSSIATSRTSSLEDLDTKFEDESENEDEYGLDEKDRHFKLVFPLETDNVKSLMELYKKKRHYRLHAKYVGEILKRSIVILKNLPNLNHASTGISKQITICGDLHGKLDDLLVIFYKNGLPSSENPYIFNGDFVDRGKRGVEVLMLLLCCLLMCPEGVYLNRGNHEDQVMNTRYGFIREVQSKYRRNADKLLKLIESVYRWLPLGTIINNKVLVVHGGISDTTDLDLIMSLDRGKYVSLLRPPLTESTAPGAEVIDKVEWKQVFDLLWSDPQTCNGCIPNALRGAGTYFGPDVTKTFLEKNRMLFIVRSHECKADGYEITHDNLIVTIFSASNYYEIGSNKGAYLKLVGPELTRHFVRYTSAVGKARALTFHQRMGLIESSAIRELHGQIMANRGRLEREFAKADPEGTGLISISEWCKIMLNSTELELPWRLLRDKLVTLDPESGSVRYSTTFENLSNKRFNSVQGASTVVETLYRNKSSLEAIFRIIDKDNSGFISLDEFSEACNLIKEHMPSPITHDQLVEICKLMDMNKDGLVDLNEFLESFRMVDLDCRRAAEPEMVNPRPEEAPIEANKDKKTSPQTEKRRKSKVSIQDIRLSSPVPSVTSKVSEAESKIAPSSTEASVGSVAAVKSPLTSPTLSGSSEKDSKVSAMTKSSLTLSKKGMCSLESEDDANSLPPSDSKVSVTVSEANENAKNLANNEVVNSNNVEKAHKNTLTMSPVLSSRRGSQV